MGNNLIILILYFNIFQQQAVVERFALCEENISILLKWINDIEQRLSVIGGPQEHIEELQTQINVLKVKFYINKFRQIYFE
jgi:hypothetical protein